MAAQRDICAQLRVEYLFSPCELAIGQVVELTAPRLVIGRSAQSDLCINHLEISRQHAEIVQEAERCWLADLGSRNGTFVNSQRLAIGQQHALMNADRVQIGQLVVLRFEDPKATLDARSLLIYVGGLALDPVRREVYLQNKKLEPRLTVQQFKLLEVLAREPGKVFTKEELIHQVWPEVKEAQGVSDQALDTVVSRVRHGLERLDKQHHYIERVRGQGIKFVPRGD
jgi:DNA-binding winged helix-turn-helix (wHTH) protein